ncbi:MAG: alpha-1,2-fucosyltransferase [Lachnospiraceae bacterium]
MIVVRIKGGLGNQMFEYAMARKLQLELGIDRLALDTTVVQQDELRNFSLHHFCLCEDVEMIDYGATGIPFRIRGEIAKRLVSYFVAGRQEDVAIRREKKLEKLFYLLGIVQKDHCAGTTSHFLLRFHRNIYMNGWFQEAKEIEPIRDILLRDFKIVECMPEKIQDMERRITAEESVCVHIRRGDYVNNTQFGVCTEAYYKAAMRAMSERLDHPVFYVFSDDIDDVKRMNLDFPVIYEDRSDYDYESLYLMTKCSHFIMSNSTFSWWGQFLSEKEGKIVMAPNRWYNDGFGEATQYLDGWILFEG